MQVFLSSPPLASAPLTPGLQVSLGDAVATNFLRSCVELELRM